MPRGYPDCFGQSIFPKYGGATEAEDTRNVTANTVNTLLTVNGKGVLYCAHLLILAGIAQKDDWFSLYVDGDEFTSESMISLKNAGHYYPSLAKWCITVYDDTLPLMVAYLQGPISFDLSIAIKYEEKAGNTPQVKSILRYALIT